MHPMLYFMAVWYRRCMRYVQWYMGRAKYASTRNAHPLPHKVKKHQSVLLRKLGESDMQLQRNKVVNLGIAIQQINGIIIRPGQTFSFCKLVGHPSKRKGYQLGMELSFGEARPGIGGGICQISNLIHWLVMHSPLTVVERYHHSFDPFPDEGRVLPFASGATVFYNYRDYQFRNDTPHTFQINLWFSDKCLEGDLRIDTDLDYAYHVYEQNHQFIKQGEHYYRSNEIWRNKYLKYKGGEVVAIELLLKNHARVMYTPEAAGVVES